MSGEVSYNLGGVKLPYLFVEWPKYRGVFAREVVMECPGEHYPKLKALAQGLGGQPTYFEVTGPDKPGNKPGDAAVRIEGVFILRVTKHNAQTCYVQLADRRVTLTRRVADMDFMIRFGDGYLEGTEFTTYQSALREVVASHDVLRGYVGAGAYADFANAALRDGEHLSGQSLPHGLAALLEESGNSLTVINQGHFRFPACEDLDAIGKLPQVSQYSWHQEPVWNALETLVLGSPRKVVCYYHERHCLRLVNEDGQTIPPGPPELQVELEQVYNDDGVIKTLAELLEDNNFGAGDLSDADICRSFWTENFELAPISSSYGTADFDRVHNAVRNDWRRLWRIKFADPRGHIGGWKDWVFGKITEDGSAQAVAVECDWVEFLTELAVPPGQQVMGSPMTINHTGAAPFAVQWEGDVSSGVIRLVQREKLRGSVALPGALETALVVEINRSNVIKDNADAEGYPIDSSFIVIERQDLGKSRFQTDFEIAIYACATKAMPNNETRWHARKIDSGLPNPDIGYVELPPSGELMLVRDYVRSGDADHFAQSDGLGPILNDSAVQNDAELRTEAWKIQHMAALDGQGVAESIMLFKDTEVRGPINEVTLVIESQVVRTRITCGNLADTQQRNRVAQKRLAERKFKVAGAV